MAQWKKLIISGANAELNSLTLSNALPVSEGGTGAVTHTSTNVLLGNGVSPVTTVARADINAASSKIIVTGGTNTVLGGNVTLEIGGTVASGSNLNKISNLSSADGNIIVGTATGWVAESGDTARTSLGLGTSDNVTFAEITNTSTVAGTQLTGSFTGSFTGDGSALTGLTSAAIANYSLSGDNRIITSVDTNSVQGEENLTFDGSTLSLTGDFTTSGDVTINGLSSGADNTVVIHSAADVLQKREIDSRVWGTSLLDGSGTSTQVSYFSDTDTLTSAATFTYDGTNVTVGGSTFGTNVNIAGNLIIQGTASFQHTDSLLVADKFILLNSGSVGGDGGFIIQSGSGGFGAAFGWDSSANRFGFQTETALDASATVMTPDAYMAAVVDVDGAGFNPNSNVYKKAGNIMISASSAWIYV